MLCNLNLKKTLVLKLIAANIYKLFICIQNMWREKDRAREKSSLMSYCESVC